MPTIPPLPQTSLVFDAGNHLITRLHAGEDRTLIHLAQVPAITRESVLAMEDERFYQHRGVDLKATLRAAYWNARSGRVVQGGSTITEQLVKNTITGDDRTLDRKIREAALALQLEKEYSKDQILEMYLNTVCFGQGAYGIQAAAKTYFSVPASRLDLNRSATLAGLIRSPSSYDPLFYPDVARTRRNEVLGQLYRLGTIDEQTYLSTVTADLELDPAEQEHTRYPAPYFVDYVKRWFLSNPAFGATPQERYDLLFKGGLRIHTTVDLGLQRDAERAISSILTEKRDPYAAMTVIDPRTGEIRAMVGGRDFFSRSDPFAKLNLATGGVTGRQAGSTFKPFALVTALQQGISPLTVFPAPAHLDIPLPHGYVDPSWSVTNYGGESFGTQTLEQATINSVNTVYAQLIMKVGPANVVRTAHAMGLTSTLRPYPSAVLGTNEVNTVEMASAYGTLATLGRHAPPVAVTEITDASGHVIYQADTRPRDVIDPQIAWTTDQIMEKVVQYGTARAANIGRPAAGKTGTAQDYTNAWFVGFVPQLTAAVWVGFPQRSDISMVYPRVRIPQVTGGSWPAQIWRTFMVNATKDLPVVNFPRPPETGSVGVAIDIGRGCLPNEWTLPKDIGVVQYPQGSQPTEVCTEPSGPQDVTVPDVVGMSKEDAEASLTDWGLSPTMKLIPEADVPPGQVVGQDPGGGTVLLQGSAVTISVSAPVSDVLMVTVPTVTGLDVDAATMLLRAIGLIPMIVDQWQCDPPASCGAQKDRVWFQDRPGGSQLATGSTVVIRVNRDEASPPPPTPSPSPSPTPSASPSGP